MVMNKRNHGTFKERDALRKYCKMQKDKNRQTHKKKTQADTRHPLTGKYVLHETN
jgi:hypothetical protein